MGNWLGHPADCKANTVLIDVRADGWRRGSFSESNKLAGSRPLSNKNVLGNFCVLSLFPGVYTDRNGSKTFTLDIFHERHVFILMAVYPFLAFSCVYTWIAKCRRGTCPHFSKIKLSAILDSTLWSTFCLRNRNSKRNFWLSKNRWKVSVSLSHLMCSYSVFGYSCTISKNGRVPFLYLAIRYCRLH